MLFIVVFVFWQRQETTGNINLALNKLVSYCNIKNLSRLMVDGQRDVNSAENILDPCTGNSFINVDVDGEFYVHYVVAFEGRSIASLGVGGLDHFLVEYSSFNGYYVPCSMYPKSSAGPRPDTGMRVNCIVGKVTNVKLSSRRNIGFAIAELEIFTLASGISGENVMIYLGCYFQFKSRLRLNWQDIKTCLRSCSDRLYMFAAIYANECHCGDLEQIVNILPITTCNVRCDDRFCGGTNSSYSVYMVNLQLPFKNGCRSGTDISGPIVSGNMTISKCLLICIDHLYAGLMNGDNCACFDEDFSTNFNEYDNCNTSCTGDPDQICGGANYYSLYATRARRSSRTVLEFIRCVGLHDEYGVCSDVCLAGYIGDYCIEASTADCELHNPCLNTSNSYCTVTNYHYDCKCKDGHTLTSKGECIDIYIGPFKSIYLFYVYVILIAFVMILLITLISWANSIFRDSTVEGSQISDQIAQAAEIGRVRSATSFTAASKISSEKLERTDYIDKLDMTTTLPQKERLTIKDIKRKQNLSKRKD